MRFGVLGPLLVQLEDGTPVEVGGRQPRLVLAALLAAGGGVVTMDALVDVLWGPAPPVSAAGTLQTYVSRLRKGFAVEPGAAKLIFDHGGYRLQADPASVDLHHFLRLSDEGRELLDVGQPARARIVLEEGLALWRGPALAGLADHPHFVGTATSLDERRLVSLEDRLEADLALGRHATVIGELLALTKAYPLREGLQSKLALALYRSGRQAEALGALAGAKRRLHDELGVDASRSLRDLEAAILRQEAGLDVPAGGVAVAAPKAPRDRPGTQAARTVPPLVGRTPELHQLTVSLHEAAADARFVVLEGEPGIGKTRLAEELRRKAVDGGSLAIWGRSDESGAAPALWPWLPVLRALAARAEGPPAWLCELIDGRRTLGLTEGTAQFDRFEAITALLESSGTPTPVVVLLDDLQWADASSLQLLAFLAAHLRRGVLVLATLRPWEVGHSDGLTTALAAIARRDGSLRVRLGGLAPEAITDILQAVLTGDISPDAAARIHRRAEGNPFYAIELARLVDDRGELAGDVPANVMDVVGRRLAQLPVDTVELLAVAAVMGRTVDLDLLARAAEVDVPDCADRIDPALVNRLLLPVPESPGVVRFAHALVREVVLEGVTALRRARLHLKVADAIEERGAGTDDAEILAQHLWQAAPVGGGSRAAEALERASEVAVHRISYASAATLLRRAAQLRRSTGASSRDWEAELQVLIRLLEVGQASRNFQAVDRDVLARAQELAARLEHTEISRILFWYEWTALGTSGRVEQAAAVAREYFSTARDDPNPQVRASGYQVYATACWAQGRIEEAVRCYDVAVALRDGEPPPTGALESKQDLGSRTFWLCAHAWHGDRPADEVFEEFDRLLDTWHGEARMAICGFAAIVAMVLGRWTELQRYVARVDEMYSAAEFPFWGGQLLMCRGIAQARTGDVAEGLASFALGRARYVEVGARTFLPTLLATMAATAAEGGHLDEAGKLIADARTELNTHRERWNEPVVLLGEAIVAQARGAVSEADRALSEARDVAQRQGAYAVARRIADRQPKQPTRDGA